MENCFHYCELKWFCIKSVERLLDFTEHFHSVKKSTTKNKDEAIYVQLFLVNILNFCSKKSIGIYCFHVYCSFYVLLNTFISHS